MHKEGFLYHPIGRFLLARLPTVHEYCCRRRTDLAFQHVNTLIKVLYSSEPTSVPLIPILNTCFTSLSKELRAIFLYSSQTLGNQKHLILAAVNYTMCFKSVLCLILLPLYLDFQRLKANNPVQMYSGSILKSMNQNGRNSVIEILLKLHTCQEDKRIQTSCLE